MIESAYMSPDTPAERLLAAIWAQVLGVERVGIHDNFFELGGDSILSIQIVARAHAAGLLLTPRLLFQHQSIAQLATVVGSAPLTRAQQDPVLGTLPLTPIWTGSTALLINLEGHGREDLFDEVDLSRTVGWFTTMVPLVLSLANDQGPGESLKHIKEFLRNLPQGGIGFGLVRYLSRDPAIRGQLAGLPQPEVSFNYGGRSALAGDEGLFAAAAESVGATHSKWGRRSHVLDIYGRIMEGQLYLGWTYSENLHRRTTIERLAHAYLEALRSLIAHCQSPEAGGYTPADFPEAELSQAALDALVAKLTEVIKED